MVEEFGTSLSVVLGLEDDYLAIIVAGFLATGSDEQGPVGDTAGTGAGRRHHNIRGRLAAATLRLTPPLRYQTLWFPLSAPSLSFSCSSPVALTAGFVYGHILMLFKGRLDHEVDDCGDDVLGQFIGIPSPLRRQLEHVNAAPLQFKSDQSQGFVEADIFKPDGKSRLPPQGSPHFILCYA